jgi:hypothetical protein
MIPIILKMLTNKANLLCCHAVLVLGYGFLSVVSLSHFFLIEDQTFCFASSGSEEAQEIGETNVSEGFTAVIFLYMMGLSMSTLSSIYGLRRVKKGDYFYVNKLEWVN